MSRTPDAIIRTHVLWATGAGAVPVPLLDLAAVSGIQLDMLKQLAACHGVAYTEQQGKSWLSVLSASLVARIGANALKLIPGIGSLIGGVSMAITSGASTYALGKVASEHFEKAGTFDDLDVEAAKVRYAEAFEEGKKVAREQAEASPAAPAREDDDVTSRLERLGALREKGLLTEAEFQAAKKQTLGEG
ncbi:MAG: DUF697 domain-containing protein [bacterium]